MPADDQTRTASTSSTASTTRKSIKDSADEVHRQSLADAVKNAHIVLAYVAEHENKALSPAEIEPVIKTSAALSSGQPLDQALELQFWETYSKLAETLKPSSVSEIVTYYESQQQHFSLKAYVLPVLAVPLFTVVMLLSLFYATDGTLLAKSLAAYLDCARASAPTAPTPPSGSGQTVSAVDQAISVAAIVDQSANCLAVTDAQPETLHIAAQEDGGPDKPHQNFLIDELGYSLYEWRKVYFFSVKSKEKYLEEKLFETNSFVLASYQLEKARVQIQLFNSWILPFLLGTLGALAQTVRSISARLAEKRGLKKTDILQYVFSVLLGSAGAIIAGVFSAADSLPSTLADLPPLILAFLVGYNANLVFSLLDSMIENLKGAFAKP